MDPINRRSVLKVAAAAAVTGFCWQAGAPGVLAETGTSPAGALDSVVFGDAASETAHGVTAASSSSIAGALGQKGRVLHRLEPAQWWGGRVSQRMKVNPAQTNYFSIKLFGGDFTSGVEKEWRLQLFIDGEVVGWLDQGPVDGLDQLGTGPRIAEQFFLHTIPLPEEKTRGKKEVQLEIRAMGRIWAYGDANKFFYPMTEDSRPIYRGYTHVEPYFTPAADDAFGTPPAIGRRADDSAEAISKVRERVIKDLNGLLYGRTASSIDLSGWMTLALGYRWEPGPAYQNPLALSKVCQALDANYLAWKRNPAVLTAGAQQWAGFGRVGQAISYLWDDLQGELEANVLPGSTDVPNPGFEVGTAGWAVNTWRGSGSVQSDTTIKRSGTSSARVVANPSTTTVSLVGLTLAQSRPLIGQGPHRVSVWCRTENISGNGAHMVVLYYGPTGQAIGTDKKFFSAAGTHDWQQISADLTTPADATSIRIDLRVEGAGTAWFDDVALEPLEGAQKPQSGDLPSRRQAYRDMLVASREYWRKNQRHYTNQTQFVALGIYECNKALTLLSPNDAWPESRAREWIYEAVGLLPLGHSETESGEKTWPLGHNYYIYSPKGLSREIGFVGSYGEVYEMLVAMYEAVTEGPAGVEDQKLRDQIIKLLTVRGYFRHESVDELGKRTMRLEQMIGWRNEHYPGEIAYGEKVNWDGHPLTIAGSLKTPTFAGWAQEQVEDGQLGPQLELLHTNLNQRTGYNAATFIIQHLPAFQQLPPSGTRLPGGWNQPDFLFTDEVNGVVALKRGKEVLYVSLYWRARQAVNNWARVHLLRPDLERSGTIAQKTEFGTATPVGEYIVPDWVTWDFAINDPIRTDLPPAGGWPAPGEPLHQAFAGRKLPIAQTPKDMDPRLGGTVQGVEAVEVGRAPLYVFKYAGYHIAMNTTTDQNFTYVCPAPGSGIDLATGRTVPLPVQRIVRPQETVVLFDPSQSR